MKKPKTVRVGDIEVTPITAKERRRLSQRVAKHHDWLRNRYKDIHGKRVDWIDHRFDDGWLYVDVRFMDGTYFSLQFSPQIVTEGAEFSDMSSGDDKILREYYRRQHED